MTDEQSFTAALTAAPDDDVCRGAFADWLTDNHGTVECPRCTDRKEIAKRPYAKIEIIKRGRFVGSCPMCNGTTRIPDDRLDRAYYHRTRIAVRPVLADPDDDVPRLEFADWADQQGRPERATLIRAQIELVNKPPCPDWCRHDPGRCPVTALECDVDRLLQVAAKDVWCGHPRFELRTRGSYGQPTDHWAADVKRGFIETVQTSGPAWAEHADHLVAHHPVRNAFLGGLPVIGYGTTVWAGGIQVRACWFVRADGTKMRTQPVTASTVGDAAVAAELARLYWPSVTVQFRA